MVSFKMQCIQNGMSPSTASPTYSSLGGAPPGIRGGEHIGHHMCLCLPDFIDYMLLQLAS